MYLADGELSHTHVSTDVFMAQEKLWLCVLAAYLLRNTRTAYIFLVIKNTKSCRKDIIIT